MMNEKQRKHQRNQAMALLVLFVWPNGMGLVSLDFYSAWFPIQLLSPIRHLSQHQPYCRFNLYP